MKKTKKITILNSNKFLKNIQRKYLISPKIAVEKLSVDWIYSCWKLFYYIN